MSYLHGIEIRESAQKTIIAAGETSVIALVGTAPQGAVGQVKLITSAQAAEAEYGKDITGFTIPGTLKMIFDQVGAKVLVVNVLTKEKADVLLEEDGTMTRTDGGDPATCIYKETIPSVVDYKSDLVAGLDLLTAIDDELGIKPNIVLVPGYSHLPEVLTKMVSVSKKLEGFAVADIVAADVQAALTARASGAFNVTDPEAVICYPQALRYNAHAKTNDLIGLSVHWAISKALRDAQEGYWVSPSNTELQGVVGLSAKITSSLTDTAADTNLLNGQGIVTVFRKSGMGTRLWGNWTAAFPTYVTTENMVAARAVRMAIREALVNAAIAYMDKNVTSIMVDRVLIDVNQFLRNLQGQQAIQQGRCYFDSAKNPSAQLAQGKTVFSFVVTYSPSLECIVFEEEIEY